MMHAGYLKMISESLNTNTFIFRWSRLVFFSLLRSTELSNAYPLLTPVENKLSTFFHIENVCNRLTIRCGQKRKQNRAHTLDRHKTEKETSDHSCDVIGVTQISGPSACDRVPKSEKSSRTSFVTMTSLQWCAFVDTSLWIAWRQLYRYE